MPLSGGTVPRTNSLYRPERHVRSGRISCFSVWPAHHKDPFDRLLIAQANAEEATLISHDPVFTHYPVKVLW